METILEDRSTFFPYEYENFISVVIRQMLYKITHGAAVKVDFYAIYHPENHRPCVIFHEVDTNYMYYCFTISGEARIENYIEDDYETIIKQLSTRPNCHIIKVDIIHYILPE